jgi:prepilin-type N-terminal cleavage/methylation domain-containing protein/prepilin-type processing-associated H-X9-DG protein
VRPLENSAGMKLRPCRVFRGSDVKGMNMVVKKSQVQGFTLIELLVVISIIALLLSILMPSLNKVREQGRKIVCGSNLKTLAAANMMYASIWKGKYVPTINYGNAWKGPGVVDNSILWGPCWWANPDFMSGLGVETKTTATLSGQLMPNRYYYCPSDKRNLIKHPELQTWNWGVQFSYGPNVMGLNAASQRELGYVSGRIKQPANKLMFADAIDYALTTAFSDYYYWDKYGETTNPSLRLHSASYRHTEGAEITFFDGHVGYLKKQQVYERGESSSETDANLQRLWLPDVSLPWIRSQGF